MKRTKKRTISEMNVVPYIDVMLVLLVIFMITTPLLQQGVEINLPQAKANALSEKDQEPLVVTVNAQGQYFLNVASDPQKPLAAEELGTRVAAELALARQTNKKIPVLVRGDKDVAYDKVVQAMVLLQQAGVEQVGLMTQTPEQTG